MQQKHFRACRRGGWAALLACAALAGGGCAGVGFIGAMIEENRRHSTRSVDAEYTGLEGRSFAVVVAADRMTQADFPDIVPRLTAAITERLEAHTGATGRIRPERMLQFMYDNPRWVAMPRGELAARLGVDRLVHVELLQYQLHDPGNQYLFDGVAVGTVGVIEADSPMPDEFMFERAIRVKFPDKSAIGPLDMAREEVAQRLVRRFVDRASWLFYKHDEPYYPEY